MHLQQAVVNKAPKAVTTKYGERTVLEVSTAIADYTVWRPAGDRFATGLRPGDCLTIAVDSRGKASLIDNETPAPMGFDTGLNPKPVEEAEALDPAQASEPAQFQVSADISGYVDRLGEVYAKCLDTAAKIPSPIYLENGARKDIATTLFIQTVKNFGL